ncbi:MAG TPA: DNA-binding response regulator [Trebonia sp.]|jgi:DNA-binding NarL/FixJ family response regulator
MEANQVAVLHGDAEFAARTGHLFAAARTTFACVVRDPGTWARVSARHRASVPAGVAVTKLVSPAVLAGEQYRDQLREITAAGAQVRVCGSALPHETIIIDQRIAIIAGGHAPAGREYTVTTSPALVAGVSDLFRAAWSAAVDFGSYLTREAPPLLDDCARDVLRALGDGLTDEAASRRLGVSLRTYRRRVADLLMALEADSRFQAGLRAGQLGLAR